jgi:ABC-type sugar transport system permease subunit
VTSAVGAAGQGVATPDRAAARSRPRRHAGRAAALWIAPAAVVLLFVFVYSMLRLVTTSFRYDGGWVGFDNFSLVVTDPLFKTAVKHNIELLLTVPVLLALALLVAVVLFETVRGQRWFRGVVFLPYILPVTVIGVVMGQILQLNGALNSFLRAAGLGFMAQDWLGDPGIALGTMAAVIVWKELGFGVILFLARMTSLSSEVYEAAKMDGATFWRMHWHITLPQMGGIIVFYAVTEAIVMVSWVFNYVYIMTNGQGGPGDSTVVTELYIYRTAFQNQAPELAAAASVLLFALTLVLVIVFFRLQRRSVHSTFGES